MEIDKFVREYRCRKCGNLLKYSEFSGECFPYCQECSTNKSTRGRKQNVLKET